MRDLPGDFWGCDLALIMRDVVAFYQCDLELFFSYAPVYKTGDLEAVFQVLVSATGG